MTAHRPLRRADRAMTRDETEALLGRERVASLATVGTDGWPYVIPVNYAYAGGEFIIHSAPDGHKVDNIRTGGRVCLCVSEVLEMVEGERACDYSVKYRSVVAFGRARVLDGVEGIEYLRRFAAAYAGDGAAVDESEAARVAVIVIEPEQITGKKSE